MGSLMSSPASPPPPPIHPSSHSNKRQCLRASQCSDTDNTQLIPGIPDELSLRILARIPRSSHFSLRRVCRLWSHTFITQELFELRKDLGVTEEWLYVLIRNSDDQLSWHALDPTSGTWQQLPPMPDMSTEENVERLHPHAHSWLGFVLKEFMSALFGRKAVADIAPFCGCAAAAVNGCLYILGGFSRSSATRSVWLYDPCVNRWKEAAAMCTPRAYCKTALLHGKLYAVGGVNRVRGGLTPLQSAEVYEPTDDTWRPIPSMPFAKAQHLPAVFPADILKPIATGMASFKEKLFVPQSLYSWPFFVDVGGEVFDPISDTWTEMPRGMGEGWPAKQAGTKLSVVVDGKLFALDPTSSLDGSKIKMYDTQTDSWKVVLQKVPILLDLSDSESPYLLAGFHNKLHVLTKDMNDHVIVLGLDMQECYPSSDPSSSPIPSESSSVAEPERWKIIARKHFGSVELVACQVLDI